MRRGIRPRVPEAPLFERGGFTARGRRREESPKSGDSLRVGLARRQAAAIKQKEEDVGRGDAEGAEKTKGGLAYAAHYQPDRASGLVIRASFVIRAWSFVITGLGWPWHAAACQGAGLA